MDIPSVGRWIMLALAAVLLVQAVRALRPALRARPGERVDAWLAFADPLAAVPVSLAPAAGEIGFLLCGLAVLGPIMAWRLARSLQARRRGPTPA
ncbi:hypothetical protein OHU17_25750 [Streptomyces goshikiensis]|uniref:Uncharacterized protein n=2 Tax=Streptomyces goshikiensis TaxID=1942 RepID=A0ABZ1RQ50_9ACTN|nr:hypothetical protein [Streptomyces goshikiensis]